MRIRIVLPWRAVLDEEAVKVVAEGPMGSFAVLPRHLDWATALVPGILSYAPPGGGERFVAVDEGIFIKRGPLVLAAVRRAVFGELGALREEVRDMLLDVDDQERKTRSAVARLEARFAKGILELEKQ